MKIKVLSGILIFSLALNLAVLGTFIYRQIDEPDRFSRFGDRSFRHPFKGEMALTDTQKDELFNIFSKFRESNRETMKRIHKLEFELDEKMRDENVTLEDVDSLLNAIGELKLAQSKKALQNFLQAKKFLSPEQREHFFRMLIQNRPGFGRKDWRDERGEEGRERIFDQDNHRRFEDPKDRD
jgi:Spy/CpxP family protein refolding chaperone